MSQLYPLVTDPKNNDRTTEAIQKLITAGLAKDLFSTVNENCGDEVLYQHTKLRISQIGDLSRFDPETGQYGKADRKSKLKS